MPVPMNRYCLDDFDFNGEKALAHLLEHSPYRSFEQAIASLTLFTHPDLVRLTKRQSLFHIRRALKGETRGQVIDTDKVILCDNTSVRQAFLWSSNLTGARIPKEVQYNHVYQGAQDKDLYTSLSNICVTPAFLAKLTDKNQKIKNLLRYHVWSTYEFCPDGQQEPEKPECYDDLIWAPYPGEGCSQGEFIARIESRIHRCPQSRIALSNYHFGWCLRPKI